MLKSGQFCILLLDTPIAMIYHEPIVFWRQVFVVDDFGLCSVLDSAPLAATPVWARDFSSPEELITEFRRECRIVRKGRRCSLLLVGSFSNGTCLRQMPRDSMTVPYPCVKTGH